MNAEMIADIATDESDELDVLQNKIADQLAELSNADLLPAGYKGKVSAFAAADVDFNSSGWLFRVLQIQVWLRLNESVDIRTLESSPSVAATELMSQMGATGILLSPNADFVKLTLAGAEVLSERLDASVRLQIAFSESLESTTRKEATKLWVDLWDEESRGKGSFDERIKAKSETKSLSDFVYYAKQGGLNLTPSYQRGDVWPTSDSQKLIESIVRGIPLPSIILLKPAGAKERKRYEVVDGKQRLTSILRFVGEHPEAIAKVKAAEKAHPDSNLLALFRNDYRKFRRVWKKVMAESLTDRLETTYYFPFPLKSTSRALSGDLKRVAGKYYCEVREEEVSVGDEIESMEMLFEMTSQYRVPIIEYLEATPRQIQEVFNLYNKQGKHLNAEEIRNALFHEVDLVRLLLVAAGDNKDFKGLASYLPETSYPRLEEIGRWLAEYKFGVARYKKTKVLSWLVALLFLPSSTAGVLTVRSTAKQIDELLSKILESSDHPLASPAKLIQLVDDLHKSLMAHSSADCWSPVFRDDDAGNKWLELHLVASLAGVFLMYFHDVDVDALLDTHRDALLGFTKATRRPENAQNNTQWGFIGEVALGMLEVVGADIERVDAKMKAAYTVSCIDTLRAARLHYKKVEPT